METETGQARARGNGSGARAGHTTSGRVGQFRSEGRRAGGRAAHGAGYPQQIGGMPQSSSAPERREDSRAPAEARRGRPDCGRRWTAPGDWRRRDSRQDLPAPPRSTLRGNSGCLWAGNRSGRRQESIRAPQLRPILKTDLATSGAGGSAEGCQRVSSRVPSIRHELKEAAQRRPHKCFLGE